MIAFCSRVTFLKLKSLGVTQMVANTTKVDAGVVRNLLLSLSVSESISHSQRSSGESIVVSSLFSLSLSFIIRLSRSNNMNWKEGPPEPETDFLLASSTTTATNNNNNPHRHGHDDEESPGALQGLEYNQDENEAPTTTPSSTPQQPHEEPEEDPSSSSALQSPWCCDDRILLIVMNLMNVLDGLIPVVSVLVGKNKDTTTNEDNNENLLDDHPYVNPIVMDLVKVRHKNQRTNSPVSSQPLVLTFDALLLSMRSFCCCPIAQQVVVALLGLVGVLQFHPTCNWVASICYHVVGVCSIWVHDSDGHSHLFFFFCMGLVHGSFYDKIRTGIMTRENYPNEAYCCCCA